MNALRALLTLIMTAGFGFFGPAKIAKASVVTESAGWDRLSEGQWAAIGVLEIAAVLALVLALLPRFRPLGIAAAAGLATLTACAVVYHLINSDPVGDIAPALIQGLVATTYVVLGTRSVRDEATSIASAVHATA